MMVKKLWLDHGIITVFIWTFMTAIIIVIFISTIMVAVNTYQSYIASTANSKVVTITGFQEPLMQGYSFLDTSDKKLLSSLGKVEIRQDLGVKATITTYRDNETPTVEIADVWMWRMVQ